MTTVRQTQNSVLLHNLMRFYKQEDNFNTMLSIINGKSPISLRIVDWFATNYAKQYYITYKTATCDRFKVYVDYKLNLRSYSKKRFDPFCRWDRINIPYKENQYIQTTIGQLNFFKWALENGVIHYIEENYKDIETDMNARNSSSKRSKDTSQSRKRREELSISASKNILHEDVEITVEFV